MGALLVCPMCAHEWSPSEADAAADAEADSAVVKDAFGTPLADGDTVSIVKDLKVKGFPQSIKVGATGEEYDRETAEDQHAR
jgi:protein PhnA